MNNETSTSLVYVEAKKVWAEISKKRQTPDLKLEIELYKKMLNIFHVGDYFYMIFNPSQTDIEYCNAGVEKVLGYTPEEFTPQLFFSRLHPDDAKNYVDYEAVLTDFFLSLPAEKVMLYKTRFDFRVKRSDGQYIRIMQQAVAIQTAEDGSIIRTLVVFTDISRLKQSDHMRLSLIGLQGEPSYLDAHLGISKKEVSKVLSPREKEVLSLLSQNKTSDEIADLLCISKHTVDNHRKKMLRKTNSSSTLQLVMRAVDNGWI